MPSSRSGWGMPFSVEALKMDELNEAIRAMLERLEEKSAPAGRGFFGGEGGKRGAGRKRRTGKRGEQLYRKKCACIYRGKLCGAAEAGRCGG